jgi:preprotein translocase subunit SecF
VKIKFIKNMNLWYFFFVVVMVASITVMAVKGFNLGVDFTGGNLLELKFQNKIETKSFNDELDKLSVKYQELKSEKRRVQFSKDENDIESIVIIRTPEMKEERKLEILNELKSIGNYEVRKAEAIGATIGSELRNSAIMALIIGTLLIVGYIAVRFEFKYAVAAIIAVIHDIAIAFGVIALMGFEINSTFIAAILTILGYSINDTIVIYDRIRENRKKMPSTELGEVMDLSINQTLGRSLNTSITTLLALVAIAVFGGDSLRTFTITLIAGIAAGTYSSIFVASPMTYLIEKKFPKKKTE